ncbi:MAG TPA: glycosyl hydrolase family 28-related protein [Anaeromyxobacteraceae bacterium]|nr:glycosyl hydrolase family 28-related protein [Anaeromyxobacteraceae bacterium]
MMTAYRRSLPSISRLTLLTFLAAGLLAGCGGVADVPAAQGGSPEAPTANTPAPSAALAVDPAIANTTVGGQVTFKALVAGSDSTVTWTVLGSGSGSVDASGKYTAPQSTGIFTVVATAGGVSASAEVNVELPRSIDANGVMPSDLVTKWDPGIPGGIPAYTNVFATIDAATYGDGVTDALAAINAAIQSAGAVASAANPQVVYLPPGNYRVSGPVSLNRSYVVLRGAGPNLSRIFTSGGNPALRVGYRFTYGAVLSVVGDVPKGSKTLTLTDASSVQVGDVLQLDEQQDDYVWLFDGHYSKRQPTSDIHGPGTGAAPWTSVAIPGGPWRAQIQQVEVAAKSGNTLTLTDPIHLGFSAARIPQVFATVPLTSTNLGTRWAGVEDVAIAGGGNNNIQMVNVAYCWLRLVESDGELIAGDPLHAGTAGAHISLVHAYRCVVRDSYVHHARNIVQGGGAYGIAVQDGSTANLVENNITVWLNKPIVMNVSGGGNVIAYNYVDNAMINGSPWQENGIDGCHQSFSHNDLIEGNWTPNIGSDSTHGNAGFHVNFRNYASGRNSMPYNIGGGVIGLPRQNMRAAGVDAWSREHAFVGNVLNVVDIGGGTYYEFTPAYHVTAASPVYRLGDNGDGGAGGHWDDGTAASMVYRNGNWDSVTGTISWDPNTTVRNLPASLYLSAKPSFFGALAWPWVDATGATAAERVRVLPAKARYDAGTPNG